MLWIKIIDVNGGETRLPKETGMIKLSEFPQPVLASSVDLVGKHISGWPFLEGSVEIASVEDVEI